MQLVTISFYLWVLSLSIVRGNCNNTLTTSLIQNQPRLLEKLINLLDVSKTSKSPVVFHAELGSYKTYQHGSIWVYDKVVTNVGKAYNPSTGKFSAPKNGVYLFNWYTLSDPKTMSHAGLFVNGAMKARQAANNNGGSGQWLTAGSSIALPLNKGDVVYIKDVHGWKAQLQSHWTAFGGVLIN